jgi:hypothetical protein
VICRIQTVDEILEQIHELTRDHSNWDNEIIQDINASGVWLETDGEVTNGQAIYVPKNKALREEIMDMLHTTPTAGHPGPEKMLEMIQRNYDWPGIKADVDKFVHGCNQCQRNKPSRTPKKWQLYPNPVAKYPWEQISWDLIGPLPESHGHNAILVIVDRYGKRAHFHPCRTTLTMEGAARIMLERVFRDHGLPRKVFSDLRSQFVSGFMAELYKKLGIKMNPSTAFHPQTDGQTEWVNQEIEKFLRMFVNYRQDDWEEWLPIGEFCYNDKKHSATGFTPFFLETSQHPWKGKISKEAPKRPEVQHFVEELERVRKQAETSLEKARKTMEKQNGKRKVPDFPDGTKVWLSAENIDTTRPSKKLDAKRYGPFKIVKKHHGRSYELDLPPQWKIHPIFHDHLLTKYTEPTADVQKKPDPPLPEVIGQSQEHEVEEILDSRYRYKKLQYLVK